MTRADVADSDPGTALFPEYDQLYDLIAGEAEGLTTRQLDFCTDRWAWAQWSIRTQLSHIAYAMYSWPLVRWGDVLFPNGEHGVEDVEGLVASGNDRRLDAQRYGELDAIMTHVRGAIDLIQRILAQRSVGFLRRHTYYRDLVPHWRLMAEAHPRGVAINEASGQVAMSLEASFRHVYFEVLTHLYNIQRMKRAQHLPAAVELPRVGYWTLEGWDRSEPDEDAQTS